MLVSNWSSTFSPVKDSFFSPASRTSRLHVTYIKLNWQFVFDITDVAQPVRHSTNICFLFLSAHLISSLCLLSGNREMPQSVPKQKKKAQQYKGQKKSEWSVSPHCLSFFISSLLSPPLAFLLLTVAGSITVETLAHLSGASGIFDTFPPWRHSQEVIPGPSLSKTASDQHCRLPLVVVVARLRSGGGLWTVVQVFEGEAWCRVPTWGYRLRTSRSKHCIDTCFLCGRLWLPAEHSCCWKL